MRDLNLLIKPASGSCNLRCKYCFYEDEVSKRSSGLCGSMSYETAEQIIDKALAYADGVCTFAFQGGEPTLRGLDFYRFFTRNVQDRNRGRCQIQYAIQTNGTLLDAEWAEFFKENHFLVGLSLDGGSEIHNLHRVDVQGKGSFNRVMRAAALLEKHQVPFNVLTVVTAKAASNIVAIYRFFVKNRLLYQQYIPCLDPIFEERGHSPYSLTPEQFGTYLCRLFDCWFQDRMAGKFVYIQFFDNLANLLQGSPPVTCGMRGVCSAQNVIEADGSVYPCDFYALDAYRIGNIHTDDFDDFNENRKPFLLQSLQGLEPCKGCEYGNICLGGCRRDRQGLDTIGQNYLCEGYKQFFRHALPRFYELLQR